MAENLKKPLDTPDKEKQEEQGTEALNKEDTSKVHSEPSKVHSESEESPEEPEKEPKESEKSEEQEEETEPEKVDKEELNKAQIRINQLKNELDDLRKIATTEDDNKVQALEERLAQYEAQEQEESKKAEEVEFRQTLKNTVTQALTQYPEPVQKAVTKLMDKNPYFIDISGANNWFEAGDKIKEQLDAFEDAFESEKPTKKVDANSPVARPEGKEVKINERSKNLTSSENEFLTEIRKISEKEEFGL